MSERSPIDQAYWERNQLVRHLTFLYPSYIGPDASCTAAEWGDVVYVDSPEGQLSWHIHTDEIREYFSHLPCRSGHVWDGHTTDEKYKRLRALNP